MNSTPLPVDITQITNPTAFRRLVEELNRTHVPRAITQGNKTVAMLQPAEKTEYSDEKPDIEEVLSLAGSWGEKNEQEWEEVERELHTIRHASPPTPPITLDP